jgi:hypothetical protein
MFLKKIGILSLAKITGLFGVILGLINGISTPYLSSKALALGLTPSSPLTALGYNTIWIMPLITGAIYFVSGIVLASAYNILAKWIGGIKIELAK